MQKKKTQSILEYVVLFSVIVFALIIGQNYIKRAYQGHIKSNVDRLGVQYSPGHTNSSIIKTIETTTNTEMKDGVTITKLTSKETSISNDEVDALARESWP